MDEKILNLIQLATSNGSISEDHKMLIYEKAKAQGISELEVQLYIDDALKKNTKNKSHSEDFTYIKDPKHQNTNARDKYNTRTWIQFIGAFIIFIAGFFPWIGSKVSSSAMGFSMGGSASLSIGFIYTIPISITSIIFAINKKLLDKNIYYGLGIVFFSLSLVIYYATSATFSGWGGQASASTSAGPGVYIMLLGGVVYLLGGLSISKNQRNNFNVEHSKEIISILIFFAAAFLLIMPIILWSSSIGLKFDYTLFLIPITGFLLLFLYKKSKLLSQIKIPLKTIIILIFIDYLFKSISLFPGSDPDQLYNDKISSELIDPIDSNVSFSGFRSFNTNWFNYYNLDTQSSDLMIFKGLLIILKILFNVIAILIAISGLVEIINFANRLFNNEKLKNISNVISKAIREKVSWNYLKNNSISFSVVRFCTMILTILIPLNLLATLVFNFAFYQNMKKAVNKEVEFSLKIIQHQKDSLAKIEFDIKERESFLKDLAIQLDQLKISDTIASDSTFVFVVQKTSDHDFVTDSLEYYEYLGFHTKTYGPYSDNLGKSILFYSIFQIKNKELAFKSKELIGKYYPNYSFYYLEALPDSIGSYQGEIK